MTDRRFYEAPVAAGARRSAPAAIRNREPIAEVLRDWLPPSGLVLEIASGSGEHVIHFAEAFPSLDWQPSDADARALQSIRAWRDAAALTNVCEPVALDASSHDWPVAAADAVLSINMVHISPWAAALGLIDGAVRILPAGGALILYGPWLKDDVPTASSNIAFDADLKRRDVEWGLRRVEDFTAAAAAKQLHLQEIRQLPANNMMLLFRAAAQRC